MDNLPARPHDAAARAHRSYTTDFSTWKKYMDDFFHGQRVVAVDALDRSRPCQKNQHISVVESSVSFLIQSLILVFVGSL